MPLHPFAVDNSLEKLRDVVAFRLSRSLLDFVELPAMLPRFNAVGRRQKGRGNVHAMFPRTRLDVKLPRYAFSPLGVRNI